MSGNTSYADAMIETYASAVVAFQKYFQLVQTLIYASSSFLFHERFGYL